MPRRLKSVTLPEARDGIAMDSGLRRLRLDELRSLGFRV